MRDINVIWMVHATPSNNQILSFVITLEVICLLFAVVEHIFMAKGQLSFDKALFFSLSLLALKFISAFSKINFVLKFILQSIFLFIFLIVIYFIFLLFLLISFLSILSHLFFYPIWSSFFIAIFMFFIFFLSLLFF